MNIKKEIDNLGFRHDWVAAQLDISKSYFSMLLSGQRSSKIVIRKIEEFIKQHPNPKARLNKKVIKG
jgi:hypothetical protein